MARKHYDWSDHRTITDSDGTAFSTWMNDENHPCKFAVHPDGFKVFLRPSEVRRLDEYLEGDPYEVAENLATPFHEQRVRLTTKMLRDVLDNFSGKLQILDVACGEGHITATIHQEFPDADIIAFDGSLTAIRRACRRYPGITFELANAYEPPYPANHFDCVICNNIWEHVPDPLRLLAAVARSLKPDGYLLISTPSRYRLGNLIRIMTARQVVFASTHHVTEYSVGQVLELLEYGGFAVDKIEGELLPPAKTKSYKSIAVYLIGRLIAVLLQISRSHHNLSPTLFYLAKKRR